MEFEHSSHNTTLEHSSVWQVEVCHSESQLLYMLENKMKYTATRLKYVSFSVCTFLLVAKCDDAARNFVK